MQSYLKDNLIFIILFIVFALFYYDSVLQKGPTNVHTWRQTDCLSITKHYAEGASFFQPEMHIQLADDNTSGKTAGEFPILYFIVGMLWKLFGESYLIYRLFYLLILFAGTLAFFNSIKLLLKSRNWALFVSLLLFTSPVYVNYGISFLTDVPAFAFVLIAFYYFLQYKRKEKDKLFIIAMIFFALAGLIKVSSLIGFLFLFGIFIIELFPLKTLSKSKLFTHTKTEWIGFSMVLVLVFSWYLYASYYNDIHGFKYTFNSVHPMWLIKEGKVSYVVSNFKNFVTHAFYSRPVLYGFLFIGFFNLLLWKKIPIFAYLANVIIIIGSVSYFILWGPLMGHHDYYYVSLLILLPGIFLPFIWYLKMNHTEIFYSNKIKWFLTFFLFFNFMYCLNVTKIKTDTSNFGISPMIGNHEFVGLMKWTNHDYNKNFKIFEEMKPLLDSIGVKPDDRVLVMTDGSFNRTLFLMDRKGWTNFKKYSKAAEIKELINKGAKYVFISEKELEKNKFMAPFLHEQIGSFKGVKIYSLEISNNSESE